MVYTSVLAADPSHSRNRRDKRRTDKKMTQWGYLRRIAAKNQGGLDH